MPLAASMLSVLPVMELNKWGWQQALSKGNKEYLSQARNNLNF